MPRSLAYLPLDELVPAEANPKDHDAGGIARSIESFGFIESFVLDERTGRLLAGHGRRASLLARREEGLDAPEGVSVDEAGRWLVPVVRGWASADDNEARAALVTVNRMVERGGWDGAALLSALDSLGSASESAGFSVSDVDDLRAALEEGPPSARDALGNHNDRAVRAFVLDFALTEYEAVVAAAAKARADLGLDSNAELLARLLEPYR